MLAVKSINNKRWIRHNSCPQGTHRTKGGIYNYHRNLIISSSEINSNSESKHEWIAGLYVYWWWGGKEWWEVECLHIYFLRKQERKTIQNSNENTDNLEASCQSYLASGNLLYSKLKCINAISVTAIY